MGDGETVMLLAESVPCQLARGSVPLVSPGLPEKEYDGRNNENGHDDDG